MMLITSLSGGGAERLVVELDSNLNNDINRKIITLTNNRTYNAIGNYESLCLNFNNKLISNFIYCLIGIIRYKKAIGNYKPNISISFLLLDNLINIISNYNDKKVKKIISIHANMHNRLYNFKYGKIIVFFFPLIMNKADKIIAVSEGVRNNLIEEFGIDADKIVVLHNPLDINKIHQLKDKIDLSVIDDQPVFINIGRLTDVKGQWHLIRAFSQVRKKIKARLVICGEGPLVDLLIKMIKEFKLMDDVLLTGWVDNPFGYLAHADIYVSSSISEALPYTILEAMACGLPIIASNCDYGPSEILNNGEFGILVPPLDYKGKSSDEPLSEAEIALANAMVDLALNSTLRDKYSKLSMNRAIDYDINTTIIKYEKLLTSMN